MNQAMDEAWVGLGAAAMIATLTWFFSSRPRLFARVFAPRSERDELSARFENDPAHKFGMRVIAVLQLAAGCIWWICRGVFFP